MTQMGLEYMKHKETGRHNIADEDIKRKSNLISKQEADTRQYVASFKPQEVAATTSQAKSAQQDADTRQYTASFKPTELAISQQDADSRTSQARSSSRQADVAGGRLALDSQFREREVTTGEQQARSSASQAATAQRRYELDAGSRAEETWAKIASANAAIEQSIAALKQAKTAEARNEIQKLQTILDHLNDIEAAGVSRDMLGGGSFDSFMSMLGKALEYLIPKFSLPLR